MRRGNERSGKVMRREEKKVEERSEEMRIKKRDGEGEE